MTGEARFTTQHPAEAERVRREVPFKIFGDNIAEGPKMVAPDFLLKALHDPGAWANGRELIAIKLNDPALDPSKLFKSPPVSVIPNTTDVIIVLNRIELIVNGQFAGHCLRMSDRDMRALRNWMQRVEQMDPANRTKLIER